MPSERLERREGEGWNNYPDNDSDRDECYVSQREEERASKSSTNFHSRDITAPS